MPAFPGRPGFNMGGYTALHLAALTAQTNAIVALLKWGVSINATNSYGMTPLDLADPFGPPPTLLMELTGLRLPFASPYSMRDNPNGQRQAAIALLMQAEAKHGERYRPTGMPMRFQ
jgi:ankyrin repeat protein